MRSLRACSVLIALQCFSTGPVTFLLAQQSSGSIAGHVTCNDGNIPARNAKVELIPLDQFEPKAASAKASHATSVETTTDLFGFYQISSVAPGTYVINATLDGYADDLKLMRTVLDRYTQEEQKTLITGFPQAIIKPASAATQDLVLRRAAAISGRLSVDTGGTVGGASVTATMVSGPLLGNSTQGTSSPFTNSAITDDRGAYRIAGLPPGNYRLSVRLTSTFFTAKISGGNQVTLLPQRAGIAELTIFAPEALEQSDAKLVKVEDGDEISGADVSIPMRILHSIGGTITSGGNPVAGAFVDVQRKGHPASGGEAVTLPDGTYRFDLLPPGSYTVIAKLPDSTSSKTGPVSGQVAAILDATDALDANIELRPANSPNH